MAPKLRSLCSPEWSILDEFHKILRETYSCKANFMNLSICQNIKVRYKCQVLFCSKFVHCNMSQHSYSGFKSIPIKVYQSKNYSRSRKVNYSSLLTCRCWFSFYAYHQSIHHLVSPILIISNVSKAKTHVYISISHRAEPTIIHLKLNT